VAYPGLAGFRETSEIRPDPGQRERSLARP
jgi:hypothetical protein